MLFGKFWLWLQVLINPAGEDSPLSWDHWERATNLNQTSLDSIRNSPILKTRAAANTTKATDGRSVTTAGSPYHGGQRPPGRSLLGLRPRGVLEGGRGVQTWVREEVCPMHAGTGLPAACLLPVCHSVLPSGWEGPRWKKNPAGYSLAFSGKGTPRRRERPGADWESLWRSCFWFPLCEYFLEL